jgi:hypothetical protein
MEQDFHATSTILSTFAVSVYVLGYAVRYRVIICYPSPLTKITP